MSSTKEKLQAVLQDAIKGGVPGISAAFANSSDKLWEGQAGFANVQDEIPINDSHIFGIGSITKVFATIVALQLVEEGRLRMTDTAGDILEVHVLDGIPNAVSATIEQLTSHTSGIPSWEDDPKWIREGRGVDIEPSRIWGKTETLEYIRKQPNSDTAGTFPFSYSNTNFTILGLIVEKLTGNTAESEIRKRILKPLNLSSTYLEGFEDSMPDILPHRYHYSTPTFRETAGISPYF